jgi:signal peptidase II
MAWWRAAFVLTLVAGADQATKQLVIGSIAPGDRHTVIPGVLALVHTSNRGIAFGATLGSGWLLDVVLALAIGALLLFFSYDTSRPLGWLPTGMITGGALGNIVDRIRAGAVTDFLALPHWPPFNLADSAITVGVLLLLYVVERDHRRQRGRMDALGARR